MNKHIELFKCDEWQRVAKESKHTLYSNFVTYALNVPGGWLFKTVHSDEAVSATPTVSMVFVPFPVETK